MSIFQGCNFATVQPDSAFPGVAHDEQEYPQDPNRSPMDRWSRRNSQEDDKDNHQCGHGNGAVQQNGATADTFNSEVQGDAAKGEDDILYSGQQ
jgi:hypothetical protein